MQNSSDSSYPPSALRTLQIIELIAASSISLSAQEIAQELDLPIASVYRIVRLLLDKNYLLGDYRSSGKYIAGPRILEISQHVQNANDLATQSRPFMRTIAERTVQACTLAVVHDDGVMVIDQVLPSKPVGIMSTIREKIPINLTASGKILTAFMPKQEQENFLRRAWRFVPTNTEKTITNLETYKQEIFLAKERKYATDLEEYSLGIGSLAVPVYDYTKQVVCAIGIVGHIQDYHNRNKFNFMLNEVIRYGKEISRKLRYTP